MKTMKRLRLGRRTLPLRLWLVLAVAAITGAGFLAQMGLVAPVSAWQQHAEDDRLASVRQIIGTDAARARNPMCKFRWTMNGSIVPTRLSRSTENPEPSENRPPQDRHRCSAAS